MNVIGHGPRKGLTFIELVANHTKLTYTRLYLEGEDRRLMHLLHLDLPVEVSAANRHLHPNVG